MSAAKHSPQDRRSERAFAVAPAAPSAHASRAVGAAFSSQSLRLSDQVATLLAVVAAHDRISPAEFIARAVCRRAEEIGIAFLTRQGDAPAPDITPESEDHGGGGNPAAPAGGGPAGGDAVRAPP
ncbi:hypothetical protein [Chelativorans sp. YIM 93263]|uniref:hypothetical protein n=1 Tax=Chelativorans sp. YIM 93263 TaxID=2906648 RepID=UPI002379FBFD|nr:hypothetical protein [Chelativorans sp. YIM 93263]